MTTFITHEHITITGKYLKLAKKFNLIENLQNVVYLRSVPSKFYSFMFLVVAFCNKKCPALTVARFSSASDSMFRFFVQIVQIRQ